MHVPERMRGDRRAALAVALASFACALAPPAHSAPARPPVRIGDPGSVYDPGKYDERFPEMPEWAKAGVEGGVPNVTRVVARLKPGDNLADAVKSAPVAPGRLGVVLLEPGEYALEATLEMKPGLVLRGADRKRTVLASSLTRGACVRMAAWSALENLTVLNSLVRERDPKEYTGVYKNLGVSTACTVHFGRGDNVWMQRCDVLFAGKNPVEIHSKGRHITVRDCVVDGAHNKGGGGAGYFDVSESKYVLIYNCTVRNIRHVSIMFNAEYVVLYGCTFEVDVNWHDGVPARTLVERCVSRPRAGHHWGSICYGWEPWQRWGPGPRNFIYDLDGSRASGRDRVWVLRDTTAKYKSMTEKEPMVMDFGPAPEGGTLYAVTGAHVPLAELERWMRENSAEAVRARARARRKAEAEAAAKEARERRAAFEGAEAERLAELRERLVKRLESGRSVAFACSMLRGRAKLGLAGRGEGFTLSASGISTRVTLEKLSASDRYRLAKAVATKGKTKADARSQALAAFFALAAGNAQAGEEHLREAGAEGARVREIFGK